MKKYKLEYIEWYDHCNYEDAGWNSVWHYKKLSPILMRSCGWVVKETKKHIVILSTLHTNNTRGTSDMCILKGTITKREVLKH